MEAERVGAVAIGALDDGRAEKVRRAVKVFTDQLVDLGGRNNLLYYRNLKSGTLDLGDANEVALSALLGKRKVAVGSLLAVDDGSPVLRQARTIHAKAQELFEERGLQTLYLACGMASWDNPGRATPRAPVLLCPAVLTPRGASKDEFELELTGEFEVNPNLLQVLTAEFGCSFDREKLDAELDGAIDTIPELRSAESWILTSAANAPDFSVTPDVVLGTFSYAKLPMVKDLEASLDQLIEHDLIAAMSGDEGAREALRSASPLGTISATDPDRISLSDEFLVLDADASQNFAINAVTAGANLVIKGPPGTGKSQTIANLMATLLARGQRVLFVAEKRAAIDAVLHRLELQKLDSLVLDLHDGAAKRKELARRLADSLHAIGKIPASDANGGRGVEALRAELNEQAAATHKVRAPWGISVHQAREESLRCPPAARLEQRLRGDTLSSLDATAIEGVCREVEEYGWLGGPGLATSGSPWARADLISPEQTSDALDLVDRLRLDLIPPMRQAFSEAARETGLKLGRTLDAHADALDLWRRAASVAATFQAGVFDEDMAAVEAGFARAADGGVGRAIAGVFSSTYRSARRQVRSLSKIADASDSELLRSLAAARELEEEWRTLSALPIPVAPPALSELGSAFDRVQADVAALGPLIDRDDLGRTPLDELAHVLAGLAADKATLQRLPEIHRLKESLTHRGLTDVVAEIGRRGMAADLRAQATRFVWLQSILDHVALRDPRIGAFDGERQRATVESYRVGDRAHVEATALRLLRRHAEWATVARDEYPDQAALVEHQASLKRKHKPLRQLFHEAPDVLLALKPCWAMSPLVVSQTLPSDRQYFDVVIFDEASQIRPADAIPSIMRGRRLVVAGDDRQLPPTDFFASATAETEVEEESTLTATSGFESILDAVMAFIPSRMLLWHYRSRDERLIAFSNTNLYDGSLTTFPGPAGQEALDHVLVPFRAVAPGQEESASDEVKAVVALVITHAETHPDESLGVITMGIKHANRIEEALRIAMRQHPELASYFDESRDERFFVKNLERVQGDERDRIILSIGYGKTAEGRLLYRFGPLNSEGGERRLNVAVTRARSHMTVVSSFSAADMDPARSDKRGVNLLRSYLQFAESGGTTLGSSALDKPVLNAFEIDVRDALTGAGIPLVAQVGCSGYFIDFAAQDPEQPGHFVLAIECDGARYHSSPTARDRDRLRQDQLERLGWTFHRIWSTEWVNNRAREVARAVTAYEAAIAAGVAAKNHPPAVALQPANPPEPSDVPPPRVGPRPFVPVGLTIDKYAGQDLISLMRWIQSDTLLRTRDELVAAAMHELGFKRHGVRVDAALSAAAEAVRSSSA